MSQEIVTKLSMKADCCSCSNGSNICRDTAIKELANKTLFVIEHDSKGSGNTLASKKSQQWGLTVFFFFLESSNSYNSNT